MFLRTSPRLVLGAAVMLAVCPAAAPARAQGREGPGPAQCAAALAAAHAKAAKLPERHVSRYVAERLLAGAAMEAGNGEYDECVDGARNAEREITERRHVLAAGERLRVTGPTGVIELHGDVP